MSKKCPCHQCKDRGGTCHDSCERYISWRNDRREATDALKEERDMEARVGEILFRKAKR